MKMQLQAFAIAAFERGRDRALERKAATFAEWGLDEPDVLPAFGTDITCGRTGPFCIAQASVLGIHETQPGIRPALQMTRELVAVWLRVHGIYYAIIERSKMPVLAFPSGEASDSMLHRK